MDESSLPAVIPTGHITGIDGLEDLDLMAVVHEDAETSLGFGSQDYMPDENFIRFFSNDAWVTRTKPAGVRSEAGDVDHVAYGLRKYVYKALKGKSSNHGRVFKDFESLMSFVGLKV